jgi:isoleucyl-tRNA synthetase
MVLSLRRKVNIKVRQPLQSIMIPAVDSLQKENIESVKDLILSEVNVKTLNYVENADEILVKKVKPDFKKLGPRYGKIMKQLAAVIQAMTPQDIALFEAAGTFTFHIEGQKSVIELSDVEIISEDIPGWLVANEGRLTIALDITVTDELKKEGLARELVNRIQNLRKNSGFEITDKIRLTISSLEEMNEALQEHKTYISNQVLATSIEIVNQVEEGTLLDFEDFNLTVKIEKE